MVDLLTREYEVNYSHIDNRGIAKPSFLWNIMQDAATVHAARRGGRTRAPARLRPGSAD